MKKHGGVYVSAYCISYNQEKGIFQSVKDARPLDYVDFDMAMKNSKFVETGRNVKSHLIFGLECDCIAEYFLHFDRETQREIKKYYGGKTIWTQEYGPGIKMVTRSEECGVVLAHRFGMLPRYSTKNLGFLVALSIE